MSHGIWKLRKYYKQTEFRVEGIPWNPSANQIENTVKSKTPEMLETSVVKDTAVGMAALEDTVAIQP
jgi:hypothetical protein